MAHPHRKVNRYVDVAIVGAGVAGLYCAWRLLGGSRKKPKIHIFEKDPRPGGRLLSVDIFKSHSRKAELGGMRFTDQQHLILALIKDLGLSKRDFTFETKRLFLRGRSFFDGPPPGAPIRRSYKFSSAVTTGPIGQLAIEVAKTGILHALKEVLDDTGNTSTRCRDHTEALMKTLSKATLTGDEWHVWQEDAQIDGIKLSSIGFWNLMQRFLKPDEFLFLHDALGYESLLANSNAAQAIPIFLGDFDVAKYWTLRDGMEAIPRALVSSIQDKHLSLCTEVRSIRRRRDGKLELAVQSTGGSDNSPGTSVHAYVADKIILAVPQAALRQIELIGFDGDALHRFRNEYLPQVTAHPAFKMFLSYAKPWWTSTIGLRGRTVTDLPIRQIYYLADRPNGKAFIMASYSDDHYVDFWAPLLEDPQRTEDEKLVHTASMRIIAKAQDQLCAVHGLKPNFIPSPVAGLVKEWPEAWHFWKVHTRPWATAAEMVNPFPGAGLYTCGEAYSLEQGWVEGALKSSERVLRELQILGPARFKDYEQYIKS